MRTLQKQILFCTRAQWTLAVLMLAALVMFYCLGYRPPTRRLMSLRATIAARQVDLQENQRKAAQRNEIAQRNEKLKAELDRLRKPSRQQELPDLIKELERGKAQASLRRSEQKLGVPLRNDLFCEQPITMSFEGNFTNVFDFLRSTEQIPRLTRVRNLNLKVKDDTRGQVQANVCMNVYFSCEQP
jgi:Tfp pilus assembly protein PilO